MDAKEFNKMLAGIDRNSAKIEYMGVKEDPTPRTTVALSGLLKNGCEHTEVLTGDLSVGAGVKAAEWQHVTHGVIYFENGSRASVDPWAIGEINMRLDNGIEPSYPSAPEGRCVAPPPSGWHAYISVETDNERFDRVKREAHEARIEEHNAYESRFDTPAACRAEQRDLQKRTQLDIAMNVTLPLDAPRLGGRRAGLES